MFNKWTKVSRESDEQSCNWLAGVGLSSFVCLRALRPLCRTRHVSCSTWMQLFENGDCVYLSRWYMLVCAASQMPLRACLFSPLLALHSWWACACTSAQRARIIATGNQIMTYMRGHIRASDRSRVICVGTLAPELTI